MQHNQTAHEDELIDLGAVENVTNGPSGDKTDFVGGLRETIGITDE